MERDFVGYGKRKPRVVWPEGARVAVSLVVNYEEGSERSYAFGDGMNETLGETQNRLDPIRDLGLESMYEYGSRAGFWRLMEVFDRHQVKVTFFACGVALEKNPEAAREITAQGHEPCSHGYRWAEHFRMDRAEEKEQIRLAVESIQRATGERPRGWYCRYAPSAHTRALLVEEGGFVYDSDSYADDLPYYVEVPGKRHLVVPYSLDCNDVKFYRAPGWTDGSDFFEYLKNTFDQLYLEGETHPKMMSVGLHMRICGRPGRAAGLEHFLRYAKSRGSVWFSRRLDIARWWLEHSTGFTG